MSAITVRTVMEAVASLHDVTLEQMTSGARTVKICGPRLIAYWLSRRLTKESLPQIGRAFKKKHTAVLYGVRKVERERAASPALDRKLALLELAIRSGNVIVPDPADRCLEDCDIVGLARGVLVERDKVLDRLGCVALAHAYLALARAQLAGTPS